MRQHLEAGRGQLVAQRLPGRDLVAAAAPAGPGHDGPLVAAPLRQLVGLAVQPGQGDVGRLERLQRVAALGRTVAQHRHLVLDVDRHHPSQRPGERLDVDPAVGVDQRVAVVDGDAHVAAAQALGLERPARGRRQLGRAPGQSAAGHPELDLVVGVVDQRPHGRPPCLVRCRSPSRVARPVRPSLARWSPGATRDLASPWHAPASPAAPRQDGRMDPTAPPRLRRDPIGPGSPVAGRGGHVHHLRHLPGHAHRASPGCGVRRWSAAVDGVRSLLRRRLLLPAPGRGQPVHRGSGGRSPSRAGPAPRERRADGGQRRDRRAVRLHRDRQQHERDRGLRHGGGGQLQRIGLRRGNPCPPPDRRAPP